MAAYQAPHPWDSPGKNTGVGCQFLLQCMKVKSGSEATQLCPNLSSSMDYSLPGSSVHGIVQARVLEWIAIAFSNSVYMSIQKKTWYIHNEILPSCKKEYVPIFSNMDGPRGYSIQWSKSHREREMLYDIAYMWNLKNNINESICKTEKDSET